MAQTWDGGGADNNWTTVNNWNPNVVPLNNGTANIIFGGATRLTPSVNASQDILSLVFSNTAGAFNVGGPGTLTIRTGGISNNDADIQTISAPITMNGAQTWNAAVGPLSFAGAGAAIVNGGARLTCNGIFDTTITHIISGAGGVDKNGAGALILSNTNTFTGTVNVNAGTLRLGANNVLADSVNVNVEIGATLDVNGRDDTVDYLYIDGPSGGTGTLNLPSGSDLTINGVGGSNGTIVGSASSRIIKDGAGEFFIAGAGANGWLGTIRVLGGTFRFPFTEQVADTSDVSVEGGTLQVEATETVDVVTMSSGQITPDAFGDGILRANAINVQSGTISVTLGGVATLNKTTAGTLMMNRDTFAGGNTHTGATSITDGLMDVINSNVLSNSSAVTITAPGALRLGGGSETILSLAGDGNVEIVSPTGVFNVSSGTTTYSGIISGDGGVNLNPDNLTLMGASTYAGATQITGGIITLGASERLPNATDLSITSGSLDLQNFNETVASLLLNDVAPSITGTGLFTAGAYDLRSGGISARLGGSAAVVKTTTGTVSLTGSNSYSGGTTITAGVLEIATFTGLGSSTPAVEIDGGTLRVLGASSTGRTFSIGAAGATFDVRGIANITGTVSGSGALTKSGSGVLELEFADFVQCTTLTVSAGRLSLIGDTQVTATGAASVAAAGMLQLDGNILNAASLANAGEIELSNDALLVTPVTNSGQILGDGVILGTLTNQTTGDVRVSTGDRLRCASTSAQSNAGLIEVVGGSFEIEGTLTNAVSTGLIFASDANLRFDLGLTNGGSVSCAGGLSLIFGDITNQSGASIVVSGQSDAVLLDDLVNAGQVRTSTGSTTTLLGAVSGAGSFPGAGVVFMEGDLRPGASPARVSFGGDLVLGAALNTHIELAGLTPGTQHDQLAVAGEVYLDGALDVQLISGFVPTPGSTFDIITAGTVSGAFTSVSLPPGFSLAYQTGRVRLQFGASPCIPCDANCDATVNALDLAPFIESLLQLAPPCSPCAGNTNADATVDGADIAGFISCLAP